MSDEPDLGAVLALAKELDVSKEAVALRNVELHPALAAVAFSQDGRLTYASTGREFSNLSIRRGQQLPSLPDIRPGSLSAMEEAHPRDWLSGRAGLELSIQSLHKGDRAITLIVATEPEEDVGEIDDLVGGLTRFR